MNRLIVVSCRNTKVSPIVVSSAGNRLSARLKKRSDPCGLNTHARGIHKAAKRRGQVSWLKSSAFLGIRLSSQWRDRAGFSPASLFSPQNRGHPDALKYKERSYADLGRTLSCDLRGVKSCQLPVLYELALWLLPLTRQSSPVRFIGFSDKRGTSTE